MRIQLCSDGIASGISKTLGAAGLPEVPAANCRIALPRAGGVYTALRPGRCFMGEELAKVDLDRQAAVFIWPVRPGETRTDSSGVRSAVRRTG